MGARWVALVGWIAVTSACSGREAALVMAGADADASSYDASSSGAPHVGYVATRGTSARGAYSIARFFPTVVDPACAYLGAAGTCSVAMCPPASAGGASENAGNIDVIAYATTGAAGLLYQGASPSGSYAAAPIFSMGGNLPLDTFLQIDAYGGADVPAFMENTTTPPVLVATSALLVDGGTLATSRDLALAWTPIGFGDAVFTVGSTGTSDPSSFGPTLVCFFDGASGAATVPQSVLASFAQASPNPAATARFVAMERDTTTLAKWTVNAIAVSGDDAQNAGVAVTVE